MAKIENQTIYEDEDLWIGMEIGNSKGIFVHNRVNKKLSPSLLRKLHRVWNNMLNIMKSLGIKEVYAPSISEIQTKFISRFGFKYAYTYNGYRVYVCNTSP